MSYLQKPKSSFIKVKCNECEHEMIIFDHAKIKVNCKNESCDALIIEPQGGKGILHAEFIEKVDNF